MSNWQDFLDAQGATRSATGEINFSNASSGGDICPDTTYITELGYQGLLAFDGADAATFLQGQVTTDVRELANGQWKLGAQCNLKGRMQASFALVQTHAEQVLLRSHASLTDVTADHLKKYAVFSKVSINNVSDHWRRIGVFGPAATKLIDQQLQQPLANVGDVQVTEDLICLKLEPQRYELWLTPERAEPLWQQLAETCTLANSQLWQLADIRAGWAEISAANTGEFGPQELHYPLIGAVSFKKGCYTGQEIVARLHYKGKLKKHMTRIALEADKLDITTAIVNAAGARRGALVMAAAVGTDRWEALAVLPDDSSEPLYLATANEQQPSTQVVRMGLPYSVPADDNTP